jgi:hypothetical protein
MDRRYITVYYSMCRILTDTGKYLKKTVFLANFLNFKFFSTVSIEGITFFYKILRKNHGRVSYISFITKPRRAIS